MNQTIQATIDKLVKHLPVKRYGKKEFIDLIKEIESGEAQIQWEEDKPVRVVRLCTAKVWSMDGSLVLVEEKQVFKDGRERIRKEKDDSLKCWISEKMQPKDLPIDALYRMLKEKLGIDRDSGVDTQFVCMSAETQEPLFCPGLTSKYVISKWRVFIPSKLIDLNGYTEVQEEKITHFKWKEAV